MTLSHRCTGLVILTAAGLLACGAASAARTEETAFPKQEGRQVVFVSEEYPPYEYYQDGVATGINVEVIGRIMGRLDVPVEFRGQPYPFTRIWMLLTKGTADISPSISYQPFRVPYLYFTPEQEAFAETGALPQDYLWLTEYVFFVPARYAASLRFDSYDQLREADYRIGVLKEYSYHPAFIQAKLNRRFFITAEDGFRALARGEIDLFPMDRTVGLWSLRDMGLSSDISYLPRPLFSKPYLLAFSRASDYPDMEKLMYAFYAGLREMRASGEYQRIRERYITPLAPAVNPRPLLFVCEEWAPFEYLRDGKPAGIDVDLTDRIMRRLGIPYEVRVYPWSRAWMMIEKGSADAVLSTSYKANRESTLFYTPEQRAFASTGKMPPDYLWVCEYVFFVKKKHAGRLRFDSYDQIRRDGYRIGTNKDYTYEPEFLSAELGCREYPDTRAGFKALVGEEIDLYPIDKTVGLATLNDMGLAESVTFLAKPLFSKPYLALFSRLSDFPSLEHIMYQFYAELRKMRANGELDEIRAAHIAEANQPEPASDD